MTRVCILAIQVPYTATGSLPPAYSTPHTHTRYPPFHPFTCPHPRHAPATPCIRPTAVPCRQCAGAVRTQETSHRLANRNTRRPLNTHTHMHIAHRTKAQPDFTHAQTKSNMKHSDPQYLRLDADSTMLHSICPSPPRPLPCSPRPYAGALLFLSVLLVLRTPRKAQNEAMKRQNLAHAIANEPKPKPS